MQRIPFGRTGRMTTRLGFGAWAIGGTWGEVSVEDAKATLHAALDEGMTFIDTADVYGDGRSERIIREVLSERPGERPFVAFIKADMEERKARAVKYYNVDSAKAEEVIRKAKALIK